MEFKFKAYATIYGEQDKEIVLRDYDEKHVDLIIDRKPIGIVSREEVRRIARAL